MSQEPNIIVIGASARAAAFSALRAGMRPYAIDLFADSDLVDVCPAVKVKRYPHDFEQALADAPQAPWVYTGGLENYPDLVERMSALRPLYGNGAEVLRKIRDPELLAACLSQADSNFEVPEIRTSPPPLGSDKEWLRKPRRSSAGLGIRQAKSNEQPGHEENFYYQQHVPGVATSAVFLANQKSSELLTPLQSESDPFPHAFLVNRACKSLGMTDQQSGVADLPEEPFLYAGSAVTSRPLDVDWQYGEWLDDLGELLTREFGLRGLFNLDLVGDYWVLEVNPRYSASVEVLEQVAGRNFLAMHVAAFEPNFQGETSCWISKCPHRVAKRIVYASSDCIVTPELDRLRRKWNVERLLPCLADIPRPGDRILRGQPVATVIVEGTSDEEVQRLLNERINAVKQALSPM
jgi:predicted ATP-grasp superfamily ATP-dependent carboligase